MLGAAMLDSTFHSRYMLRRGSVELRVLAAGGADETSEGADAESTAEQVPTAVPHAQAQVASLKASSDGGGGLSSPSAAIIPGNTSPPTPAATTASPALVPRGEGPPSSTAALVVTIISAPEASHGEGCVPTTIRPPPSSSAPTLSHSDPISSVTTENTVSHGSRGGRGGGASSSAPFESHTCDYIGSLFILSHDIQLCEKKRTLTSSLLYESFRGESLCRRCECFWSE